MKTMRRKAKEKLLAHGIRVLNKQGVGTVKLAHMKTSDLVREAAKLSEEE